MLESIHTYPRRLRWVAELISATLVLITALLAGRALLQLGWATWELDRALFDQLPFLNNAVRLIGIADTRAINVGDLARALGWLALALLLALVLRNALPTVRTSTQGLLVEFGNGWLPIGWENLRAIKVTQDPGGKRYVLLVETKRQTLTDWHRLYGLIYRLRMRRAFLISSSITNFEGLVRTMLSETDRIARVLEGVEPIRLDERASSPLISFFMSPSAFFGRRTAADDQANTAPVTAQTPVIHGSYPRRIRMLLTVLAGLLVALAIWNLLQELVRLAALYLLFVRRIVQQYGIQLYEAPGGEGFGRIWLLIAALLLLGLTLLAAQALRGLLPELEARAEGLRVRHGGSWRQLPWRSVSAIKDTEISEHNHILLLQLRAGLPWTARLASLLYEGRWRPGILVTSALSNFEPLMQRIVLEVTRAHQAGQTVVADGPLLRSHEYSPLLLTTLRPGSGIDRQVAQAREEDPPPPVTTGRLLRSAQPMLALALLPALLLIVEVALRQGQVPSLNLLAGALALVFFSFLEWPVVSLLAQIFDEGSAPSPEGTRGLYLYPTIQLPRIIALLAALILLLVAGSLPLIGGLVILLWLGSIAWSFLLAAGLWESLYEWHGSQLLIGGIVPAAYQLLVLLAYLVVSS